MFSEFSFAFIILVPKWICVTVVSILELSIRCSIIFMCFILFDNFSSVIASGQLSLFLKLHERPSLLGDEDKILQLFCFVKLDILPMQLWLNYMMFRLKICGDGKVLGIFFIIIINFKKNFPILLLTFWLNVW